MFSRIRLQITVTAASAACIIVAVLAAGAAIYSGLRLVLQPYASAAVTALVFFGLAVGLMMILKEEESRPVAAPVAERGSKVRRWAALAGEVAGAFAAGAIGAPTRRPGGRR